MLWVCMASARSREFFRIKINRIELSTGKILEEGKPASVCFTTDRHWKSNSPFSRTVT